MSWGYRVDERALKEFKNLNSQAQRQIISFLDERIAVDSDPRRFGKALKGSFKGLWRYRIGDYRLVCQIRDHELLVLVLRVGARKDVYR